MTQRDVIYQRAEAAWCRANATPSAIFPNPANNNPGPYLLMPGSGNALTRIEGFATSTPRLAAMASTNALQKAVSTSSRGPNVDSGILWLRRIVAPLERDLPSGGNRGLPHTRNPSRDACNRVRAYVELQVVELQVGAARRARRVRPPAPPAD